MAGFAPDNSSSMPELANDRLQREGSRDPEQEEDAGPATAGPTCRALPKRAIVRLDAAGPLRELTARGPAGPAIPALLGGVPPGAAPSPGRRGRTASGRRGRPLRARTPPPAPAEAPSSSPARPPATDPAGPPHL